MHATRRGINNIHKYKCKVTTKQGARARIMRAHASVCLRLQQFVTLIYDILSNFRSQLVTI